MADGLGQLEHRQCGAVETQNFRGLSSGADLSQTLRKGLYLLGRALPSYSSLTLA